MNKHFVVKRVGMGEMHDTYTDAVKAGTRRAARYQDDIVIYEAISLVEPQLPDAIITPLKYIEGK